MIVAPGLALSVSPGDLLELWISGPVWDLASQTLWEWDSEFYQAFQVTGDGNWCTLQFKNVVHVVKVTGLNSEVDTDLILCPDHNC